MMARKSKFELAIEELLGDLNSKKARSRVNELREELEDHEDILEKIRNSRSTRHVAVTFDRRTNDANFSYSDFDLLLVVLDAVCGGAGIHKPVNQVRALRWKAADSDLVVILSRFAKSNASLNFRRLLIIPFHPPPTGVRIDNKIYKK